MRKAAEKCKDWPNEKNVLVELFLNLRLKAETDEYLKALMFTYSQRICTFVEPFDESLGTTCR